MIKMLWFIFSKQIKRYLLANNIYSISLSGDKYSKLVILPLVNEIDKKQMDDLIDFAVSLINRISDYSKKLSKSV
jgi:hypothetical protein